MDIQVRPDAAGCFVVSCPSRMEWDARIDLVSALQQASSGRQVSSVIVDLKNVSYMNSAGLGAIFKLLEFGRQANAPVAISRPNPTIWRLLNTVNLPALAPIADSIQGARVAAGAEA